MKKEKIMFVMLRTLGDVIISTTIIKELKTEFPDSEIYFYVNGHYAPLLANNPDIQEIKSSKEWLPDLVFMDMALNNYDKIFAPYQCRRECNMWHQNEAVRHQHLLDFYWQRMGMHRPIEKRECYLYPSDEDFKNAEEHISLDVPRIALHGTTNVSTKDWPFFGELTEELRKAGYAAIQIGIDTDKKIEGAIDLRGKMGLLELAAFLSKCAVFIGLDSGLSYMADAMKVPTVVIQGSTNPVTSGPISDRVIHLFAKETGYPDCQIVRCHVNCRHEVNCITKISVNDVLDVIDPVLTKWRPVISAGV